MASKAFKSSKINSVLPLYINLKGLERTADVQIDRNLIRSFILESISRAIDIDTARFLEDEFDQGLKDGTWLFLFDSFDEIPEILSATESDSIVRNYADAISDFLHGFNRCRGIIASRQFRGPKQVGWYRFRILPLTEKRRIDLIRRADLKTQIENNLIGNLGLTRNEIHTMASNPMFLSLLCEHMREGNPFPVNAHSVFESYVELRLTRDAARVKVRFGVEASEVRSAAEAIAFCMAADGRIGLTGTRQSIKEATIRLNIEIGEQFHALLDALEYIKLARSEDSSSFGDLRAFTFAHRRFQEYFATSVVLRSPQIVSPLQLLNDARWRETAVVMCQSQGIEVLSPLLGEARLMLTKMVDDLREKIELPEDLLEIYTSQKNTNVDDDLTSDDSFPWPANALHILSLLQDGFVSRMKELPDDIRNKAGLIIIAADRLGTLIDKKWALEVAGTIPTLSLLSLLRRGFIHKSQWLRDNAYKQAERLNEIPPDIAKWIRKTVVYMALDGYLWRQRHSVRTFLARLENSSTFLSPLRLVLFAWIIDLALHVVLFFYFVSPFNVLNNRPKTAGGLINLLIILMFSWGGFWWISYIFSFISLRRESMLFLSTYIRIVLPFSIFSVIIFKQHGDILGLVQYGFLITLLVSFWAPSALRCAEEGRFTNPMWWPLLPVFGFTSLLFAFNKSRFIYLLRKISIKVVAVTTISLSLIFAVGYYFFQYHKTSFFIVVASFYGLVMIWLIGISSFWLMENFKFFYWSKLHSSQLKTQNFLQMLVSYRFSTVATKYIRLVRTQGLLEVTTESEATIRKLALKTEILLANRSKKEKKKAQDESVKSSKIDTPEKGLELFDDWYATDNKRKKLEKVCSYELIDEVYKLYEQLRSQPK